LLLSGRVALGVALVAHVLLCLTLVGEYRATQLEQHEVAAGVAWWLAMLAAITAGALYGWINRSWWSLLLATCGWLGASIGAFLLSRKLGYVDSETEGTGGELLPPSVRLAARRRRRQAITTWPGSTSVACSMRDAAGGDELVRRAA
jgi:hypothetical protein